MKKLKIVFMGTPEFAVGILDSIIKNNYEVVGVITAADKPAGRGQKVKFSAVKDYALQNNLNLLQPTNLKDPAFLAELASLKANLQIVVAFRMLPKVVWEMPELGTFNLHASLLPNYRGAAPINWAIINGEKTTGVTTFFIDDQIDTGAMILNNSLEINEKENAGELHDRLLNLGSQTVLETLGLIENDKVNLTTQFESDDLKTAYKLNKENCKIDWNKSLKEINNLIRGLSPYPAAWTQMVVNEQELAVKIYEADFVIEQHNCKMFTILTSKKEIKISHPEGFLLLKSMQFPGKRKMSTQEILNGTKFSENSFVS